MGSILDVLPREGALFAGRTGALPLPDGRVLLVSPGSAHVASAADEPRDNAIPAPDDSAPVRRPAYLDARPLFAPRPEEADPVETFQRLWPRRDESDDYVRQDPYTGGMIRVAQAARAGVAGGEKPVALSFRLAVPLSPRWDSLGEGPAYQLRQIVRGMADAATMLGLPVLAGQLHAGRLDLEAFAHTADAASFSSTAWPAPAPRTGDVAALVGRMADDVSGSLYLDAADSFPPAIDLVVEGRVLEIVQALGGGAPLGRGGLLLTLARCCAQARLGARLTLPRAWLSLSRAAVLFGEAQSRFLVFLPPSRIQELLDKAGSLAVPVEPLGELGGADLSLDGIINLDVRELQSWTS